MELVKITHKDGKDIVSARELYDALGYEPSHWKRWYTKNIENNPFAIENEDWVGFATMANGNPTMDFAITTEFAKRLSMMARTETGEKLRNYFIDCERRANNHQLPTTKELAQMVIDAENRNEALQLVIRDNEPKVLFSDAVSVSKTTILIGELAKILKQNGIDIGQNRLFSWLRDNDYLVSRKGTDFNMPTQKSMNLGLFVIKETVISHSDGHTSINKTPKMTGKGQIYFVNKFIRGDDFSLTA